MLTPNACTLRGCRPGWAACSRTDETAQARSVVSAGERQLERRVVKCRKSGVFSSAEVAELVACAHTKVNRRTNPPGIPSTEFASPAIAIIAVVILAHRLGPIPARTQPGV